VPLLIDLLDQLTGRLAWETGRALATLTGMNLGLRSKSWKRWWGDHRDTFTPPDPELARWTEVEPTGETFAFYGIPVHSSRLAFVLDVSGSMDGPKLWRLKDELTGILERLPEHALFNVIFFSDRAHPWKDRLQRLNERNRTAAIEEVKERSAGGGTNLWDGLVEAFEDEEIDTIYLLSDGEPTAGAVTSLAGICDRITEMNRSRRVVIHVVLIGMKSGDLERLALDSGGTYVRYET